MGLGFTLSTYKLDMNAVPLNSLNAAKLSGKLNRGIIVAFLHLSSQMYAEKWEGPSYRQISLLGNKNQSFHFLTTSIS